MKGYRISFLKTAVIIMGLLTLILCIFWLPWEAKFAAITNPEYAYLRYPVLIGVYITAIPFYLALYQALKLLNHIKRNNAFSELALIPLKNIKYYGITEIVLYVIGLFFLGFLNALHPGIAIIGLVIIFASLIVSLIAAVLQELLKNAIEIKSENDLTV